MTKKKPTKEKAAAQPQALPPIARIAPDKHHYDVDALSYFLQRVFHTEIAADEEVLTWITKSIPAYPMSEDEMLDKLERVPLPKALYYSTATTVRDPHDGELYNRKALFKRFHVLVLDDIGTKVDIDFLKSDFKPTYIIETSEGSYHYGYVLAEPITVLEQAEALVQLVYEAGYSDKGGKMANKLVRLPDGVNGKKGSKEFFPVRLVSFDGPLWTPTDILSVLDLGVTWAEIEADANLVSKQRANKGTGLTAWSPIRPNMPTVTGIIDPVVEWLYDMDMIKQETNEWLTVECPWCDQHTTGGDWASYSPLGWGGAAYERNRGFHCFHEHCHSRRGQDFVDFVAASDGPQVPVTERAAHLTSTYAFDPINNGVWQIKGVRQPVYIPLEGFKNLHPEKAKVSFGDGKHRLVAETTLFIQSKARVVVRGQTYDPSDSSKLITDTDGTHRVNTYTIPPWGDGDYDKDHVATFKQFIGYLIPDEKAREFFLDWLAAKCQSMAFRGPAILMIAPMQGTGRSTLGNMLATMFSIENVEHVPFERLSRGSEGYNDWITKPLIVTNETLALGSSDNYFKVYEKIKELIDTTPQMVRVNPKYGKQRFQITYSSFLLFSNHEGAMSVAEDDRRIYVIDNALKPESGEYFMKLNAWIRTDWQRSVWRWLRVRDVNMETLVTPVEMTKAKRHMIDTHKQALDIAVETVLHSWPARVIATYQIKTLLMPFQMRFNLTDSTQLNKRINAAVRHGTDKLPTFAVDKYRLGAIVTRLRAVKKREPFADALEILAEIDKLPDDDMLVGIRQNISDALDLADF